MASSWPTSPAAARRLQETLCSRVVAEDRLGPVRRVAGLDAHYGTSRVWGAAAVMSFPGLVALESGLAWRRLAFPYVPGLLSFREAPALLAALGRLGAAPDLLLVDGQGLAHPRRFGLACHVGVLADLPTIGVAKSRLIGAFEEPGIERGAWTPLVHGGETAGAVVRTRRAVRPVFVSVGHRVGLATAIDLVLRCTGRFRLPEPIRAADRLSRSHGPSRAGGITSGPAGASSRATSGC
jgi:deoxyribonuclease V